MKQSLLFTLQSHNGSEATKALLKIKEMARSCRSCPALFEQRRNIVLGEGKNERPLVAMVGEAPGDPEDATGRPFQGQSQEYLNQMLDWIQLPRELVYLCNVVLCRPTLKQESQLVNRMPTAKECANCRPFFTGQLHAVRPHMIVALGMTATKALGGNWAARGTWFEWEGYPVLSTWHPSFVSKKVKQGELMEAQQLRQDMGLVFERIQSL